MRRYSSGFLVLAFMVGVACTSDADSGPELAPYEVLMFSREAMGKVETLHINTLRRISINGEESGARLDYDVQQPGKLQGFIEFPDFPTVEVFEQDRTGYFRERNGIWQCLSDATNARPDALGFVIPDFEQLLQGVGELEFQADAPDDEFFRITASGPAPSFRSAVPDLLGADSQLRLRYPEIGQGDARVEFVIGKDDYLVRELVYELRMPVEDDQVVVRNESVYSDFDTPSAFPNVRTLPLCSSYAKPPCKGDRLNVCLSPPNGMQEPSVSPGACDGDGRRVCIVPFGAVDPGLLGSVLDRLNDLVDVPVAIAPAQHLTTDVNRSREQVGDDQLLLGMGVEFGDAFHDLDVIYIAITPVDLYSVEDPTLRFLFGTRAGETTDRYHWGIISYWRMDPESYGLAADRRLLEERLTKMLLKYVLTMYLDYSTTSDPTSVLYNHIYSIGELDAVILEVPVR